MSDPDDLELVALICSRLCHDLISPVGAIANGFEVLEEEHDAEMRDMALAVIRTNGHKASARLQFARVAFGAMGSGGERLSLDEARRLTEALYEGEKVSVRWAEETGDLPKNEVKLLLNLVTIAIQAIPRGGEVSVEVDGGSFRLVAQGPHAVVPAVARAILDGVPPEGRIDAHSVQPYYTARLAKSVGAEIELRAVGEDKVEITAGRAG